MLNQLIICGRIASMEDKELDGTKVKEVIIAIPRPYKNVDGSYDTDFIPIVLNGTIADTTCEYCKKGDVVGIKGSIRSFKSEKAQYPFYLQAEKVSFLSSGAKTSDEEEEDD